MFDTDLVEGTRDQGKFLEEIFVFVFSYDIKEYFNVSLYFQSQFFRLLEFDSHLSVTIVGVPYTSGLPILYASSKHAGYIRKGKERI